MSYPSMTEQEFSELEDVEFKECGDSCGHFDSLNECCWITWKHKWYGDHCDVGLVEDSEMNVYILVKEKSIDPNEVRRDQE